MKDLKPFLEAAAEGNIDRFRDCISQDEEAFKRFDEAELIDTPLHIAARKGDVKFAMAMLYLKPSYGKKLNKEMNSPMHIAVQNGLENLVCALLRIDKDLVRLKGKEGYTALHCAAEKGDTELLVLFLKDCPACIEDVTTENETALHVAAKKGKWEALEILARFLQRTHLYCTAVSKRYILEIKDVKGNTVLHIAASNAQPDQMVELILECSSTKIKDEKNIHGSTALELLPPESKILEHERRNVCQNYVKEMVNDFVPYIKQNICSAHNSWWAPILKVICPIECSSSEENVSLNLRATVYERNITRVTVGMANQSSDQINAVLVVLALILTATYQALLTPPGGVWQGDVDEYNANRHSGLVGRSVMDNLSFGILYWLNFVVFNVTAFFSVFFLYLLSKNSVVVMLAELLLSLLIGCILVALLVIKPSREYSGPKVKAAICLSSIVSFVVMEVTRKILMFIYNPPIIKSFRKFFLEIQNKF